MPLPELFSLGSRLTLQGRRCIDTLGGVKAPQGSNAEVKFRAQLIDEATIVERGEQLKTWFVPLGNGWVRAKDHPGAEVEESRADSPSSCPPGTVWQRNIEIVLAPKTPLLCRVTRPLVEPLDMVDYITKERRTMRRHVEERWYLLIGNYRMCRSHEPPSFSQARREHEKLTAKQPR